tara:strand:+ start:128 stop:505 length:378 start_codon:yes stop_codon:yes gene_type:complete
MTNTALDTETSVYKVLTLQEWEGASKTGLIITDLDQKDGFIHLSSASQLNATLALYFSQEEQVVLLQIKESEIAKDLAHEISEKRGGEFAHLYGELSTKKIAQSWHLDRSAFSIPLDVMLQAEKD